MQHKSMTNGLRAGVSAAVLVTAVAACGGGGGGSGSGSPVTSATSSSSTSSTPVRVGKVSALYQYDTTSRYGYDAIGLYSAGVLAATYAAESATGAVANLGAYILSGSGNEIDDIQGNAWWTMGRWKSGVVTTLSSGSTSTLAVNDSGHYLLWHALAALPTVGTYTCGSAYTTTPTIRDWTTATLASAAYTANVSDQGASLSFSASGAAVGTNVSVSQGGATATLNAAVNITTPAGSVMSGNFLAVGDGTGLTLGDGGSGKVLIILEYKKTLSSGNQYYGRALWECTP